MDILKGLDKDQKVLIFCNAKKAADFLAVSLSGSGVSTTSIHGDRLQSQRELALGEFSHGKKQVLVATAVAARGLDIPKVALVVNFDLPKEVEEYVHRIGRTGRVGHAGRAISFYEVGQDDNLVSPLIGILKEANQTVPDFFTGTGSGFGGGGDFGGRDYRKMENGNGAAAAADEDEGDWD